MVISVTSDGPNTQLPFGVFITILWTSSIGSSCMPSFFIIVFIWRGLMFPGSILLTPLPYSYRCTIIKCKHLRARKECSAAGNEPIPARNNQYDVLRADLRVCRDHVLCKRILPLRHKLCDIVPDDHPVAGRREDRMEPAAPLHPEREPAVRRPDRRKPHAAVQDLADTSRC